MSDKTYALQNRTRPEVVERRKVLYDLYERSPLPIDELMVNLGLYMRSGAPLHHCGFFRVELPREHLLVTENPPDRTSTLERPDFS